MRYIDSWLSGLGLEYIIPKLKANGITTPKKLALLSLRDMYEVGESRTSLGTPFLRNLPDLFLDRQLLSRNPSITITSPYQHNDCFSNCTRAVFSGLKQ